ncbi:unnamed protein product [Rhizoctonia solani]|uniref:DUF6535 domain-containing protein n=1 Tax=Rhizoctonia solani TaxID=456999 RepID=A0A8H2WMF9_9AGAM|nr:unnamed protein product [Rhizoctonia solani]
MPSAYFKAAQPKGADPIMEPDEYGAELGKEARVWRIYVRESDRSDAELVDRWNKSLDVILGGIVLGHFNCILDRKLAEITGRSCQRDSTDATDYISDPLIYGQWIIVAVSTLWYLSLSLSVATSLLAMLAKDWCYSFMAGRTGHAYNQTLRRQRKWTMIETWKMQELIVVLPSLIHLSLLLFAVGLCIYVTELNTSAGILVICVTGAALCFYVWSSLTASVIKYFPYTTVISRFLRSDWANQLLTQRLILWFCRYYWVSPRTAVRHRVEDERRIINQDCLRELHATRSIAPSPNLLNNNTNTNIIQANDYDKAGSSYQPVPSTHSATPSKCSITPSIHMSYPSNLGPESPLDGNLVLPEPATEVNLHHPTAREPSLQVEYGEDEDESMYFERYNVTKDPPHIRLAYLSAMESSVHPFALRMQYLMALDH